MGFNVFFAIVFSLFERTTIINPSKLNIPLNVGGEITRNIFRTHDCAHTLSYVQSHRYNSYKSIEIEIYVDI